MLLLNLLSFSALYTISTKLSLARPQSQTSIAELLDIHPPDYPASQCEYSPASQHDWDDLEPQTGPLPPPDIFKPEDLFNGTSQFLKSTDNNNSPLCEQRRVYRFNGVLNGVIRTHPYPISRNPDNIFWFVWALIEEDARAVVTEWTKEPERGAWDRECVSGVSGSRMGGTAKKGNLTVMYDVDLRPLPEGTSGEIALFWTKDFGKGRANDLQFSPITVWVFCQHCL